jgi:hypothetical protein
VANAEVEWQARASEIRDGKRKSMLTTLEERGFVHALAGLAMFIGNCIYGILVLIQFL